jgi:hypothetical protein
VCRFNDDNSDYDPSDSDEDYTENEKILLKKLEIDIQKTQTVK